MNDTQRLAACATLAVMILDGDPAVRKDESNQPELRDLVRIASGRAPRTTAGKQAAELAARGEGRGIAEGDEEPSEGVGDCG